MDINEEIKPINLSRFSSILKPLDLLLFSGGDLISNLIKFIEARVLEDKSGNLVKPGEYSHVGLVITSDILDHPNIEKGKYYILESTMSGRYGQKLGNIDNMKNVLCGFLGVQIRDFDLLHTKYLKSNKTKIAFARLKNNPYDYMDRNELKLKFKDIYENYNGITYDANCCSLLSSLLPICRCIRSPSEKLLGTSDWLFCSELVAQVYKDLGILPEELNIKNVVPMDFVGYESDEEGIPLDLYILPPIAL